MLTSTQKKKNLENKNEKKNNCMDTSSDKLMSFLWGDNDLAMKGETEYFWIAARKN